LVNYSDLIPDDEIPLGEETERLPNIGIQKWDKLFNRLGRPENADGYEIETPDYKFDDNVLKEIKKAAHEAGLTKTQANKVIGSIAKMSREAMEVLESSKAAQLEAVKAERSKWEDLSTTETKVDLFLKQNTKNVEDYEKLKSLIDTDNNLYLNEVFPHIKTGWNIILNDDTYFNNDNALSIISNKIIENGINNTNYLYLWNWGTGGGFVNLGNGPKTNTFPCIGPV
jgi:hypothetical protein